MNTVPVAGGELYEMWGWSCSHKGCKTSFRHRNEQVVRGLAVGHKAEEHPEIDGQTSLLDEIITDDTPTDTLDPLGI
jgi:hypothetical protein